MSSGSKKDRQGCEVLTLMLQALQSIITSEALPADQVLVRPLTQLHCVVVFYIFQRCKQDGFKYLLVQKDAASRVSAHLLSVQLLKN